MTRIESHGSRWHAHRFEVLRPADVDAIEELPTLLGEAYHDLGPRESLGWCRARSEP